MALLSPLEGAAIAVRGNSSDPLLEVLESLMHFGVLESLRPAFFLPPKGYGHQAAQIWAAQHCHLVVTQFPSSRMSPGVHGLWQGVGQRPMFPPSHLCLPTPMLCQALGEQQGVSGQSRGTKGRLELEAGKFGTCWAPFVWVEGRSVPEGTWAIDRRSSWKILM